MTREVRSWMTGEEKPTGVFIPKRVQKQEFARRLYDLMTKKGMIQADLVRASEVNKDSLSSYINAKQLPSNANAEKLAGALGVSVGDLLGNIWADATEKEAMPALDIKVSQETPGMAWLRVDRLVRLDTAVKVGQLIAEDMVTIGNAAKISDRS